MQSKLNLIVAFIVAFAAFLIIMLVFFENPLARPGIKVDLSRTSVVHEIQSLNRLETASFTIEKIVEAGEEGNVFQDLLYGDRILLIAHGKVTAGVDLSGIEEDDVRVEGDTLSVDLPAPIIFSSTLDNSKTTVYDRSQGLLSRGNRDLESEARLAAEESIRQAACDAGVLEEARENASQRLKELFMFAGFSEVSVNVPRGNC